ncbi:hypothetical protein BCR36DRAFT_137718 [Piromyces finnis]|uniref:Uncharacterized protein n=1 Tax=Piromyces finnis TaxID=1754191 RepID=A0A1Y1VJJ5_9FUNG|nr:hypothetical protein BCR36DRAFT_137718 [Piromyces finnis]|eukprot:ORX57844.1 hypothetical protein BCR36DRAFT_137718 [Piromyces finnis]
MKYENIDIYIIELSRCNIKNFDVHDTKNVWLAFLKCITYETIEIEKKNGNKEKYRIPVNNLTNDLIELLKGIKETKDAMDICTLNDKNEKCKEN